MAKRRRVTFQTRDGEASFLAKTSKDKRSKRKRTATGKKGMLKALRSPDTPKHLKKGIRAHARKMRWI